MCGSTRIGATAGDRTKTSLKANFFAEFCFTLHAGQPGLSSINQGLDHAFDEPGYR
jgi:hypothetical protein